MKNYLSIFLLLLPFVMSAQCETVTMSTQLEIDSFNCSEILGDLIIVDNNDNIDPITSLLPLRNANLKSISGSLLISNCNSLMSLDGIDQIDSIGQNFVVNYNDSLLVFYTTDSINLLNIKFIGNKLMVHDNPQLRDIGGFSNLKNDQLIIHIANQDSLISVQSFDHLEKIRQLDFINNSVFNNSISFPILTSISDSLNIHGNRNLDNCTWVRNLMLKTEGVVTVIENSPRCNTKIDVNDDGPVFSNCPENIEINNLDGQCTGIYSYFDPNIADNEGVLEYKLKIRSSLGEILLERDAIEGMSWVQEGLTIGDNVFTYQAIDENENSGFCEYTVKIIDTEPPVIIEDLMDITINTSPENCQGELTLTFPNVIENCQVKHLEILIIDNFTLDTVYNTQAMEGVMYNIVLNSGEYIASFNVEDESSLTDFFSAKITVIENNNIQLDNCPEPTTIESNEDCLNILTYTSPDLINGCSNSRMLREIIDENGNIFKNGLIGPNTIYTDTFPEGVNTLVFRYINGENVEQCSTTITASKHIVEGVTLSSIDLNCNTFLGEISAQLDSVNGNYNWTGPNGYTSEALVNEVKIPGRYVFKLFQENGCVSEYGVDVLIADTRVDFDIELGAINCEEGERIIQIDKTLDDFEFQWKGPSEFESTLESPYIESAGWYFLNVEGNYGCMGIDSFYLESDVSFDYELLIEDNSVEILIEGGTPPFIFKWDGVSNGSKVDSLENGTHTLRVVDGLGCIKDIAFEIMLSRTSSLNIDHVQLFPNPSDKFVKIKGASADFIEIYNAQGLLIKSLDIQREETLIDINHLTSGIYFIKIKNRDTIKTISFLKI